MCCICVSAWTPLAGGGIRDVRWLSDSAMCFYEISWQFPPGSRDCHDALSHDKES